MRFKIYDSYNKIMYYDAERIQDDVWDFSRLHNNKHCITCVTVGKKDCKDNDIFTYDLVSIYGSIFYVSDIKDGHVILKGINHNKVELLSNYESYQLEVLGSFLELSSQQDVYELNNKLD